MKQIKFLLFPKNVGVPITPLINIELINYSGLKFDLNNKSKLSEKCSTSEY